MSGFQDPNNTCESAANEPPVRKIGRIEIRPGPIAILTERGTIRTRRRVPSATPRYPISSPGAWMADGHRTAHVRCTWCGHQVNSLRLDQLPPDWPWRRVCRAMLCTECGTPGCVHVVPNWHDNSLHKTPFTSAWRADPPA